MNPLKTSRVLIADDDPVIRHWLTAILTRDGYEVISKRDGREAYRCLQSDANFKGAVLDMSMPHLDGPDLIRHMRTEKRLMRIPVMMIASESDIKTLAQGTSAGATCVLPKPFTQARLRQTLRLMLGPAAAAQSNSSSTANQRERGNTKSAVRRSTPISIAAQTAPEPHAQRPPAVDSQVLRTLVGDDYEGGATLICELIDIYLDATERELTAIESSVRTGNWTSVKARCHSLKGMSLTMGAAPIAKLCDHLAALDQLSASGQLERVLNEMRNEFAQIRMALVERPESFQLVSA